MREEEIIRKCRQSIFQYDISLLKHCNRTAVIVNNILDYLNMEDSNIATAASIHDIGKLIIPKTILDKPGKFTPIEKKMVDTHSFIGYGYAMNLGISTDISELILLHHGIDKERYNNLKHPGKKLIYRAQILQAADMYDALTSKRCYRDKISHDRALEIIMKEKLPAEIIQALEEKKEYIDNGKYIYNMQEIFPASV